MAWRLWHAWLRQPGHTPDRPGCMGMPSLRPRQREQAYDQLRAVDGRALREAYGSIARPENFLVDPEGGIAVIHRGAVTANDLKKRFEPLIRGGA